MLQYLSEKMVSTVIERKYVKDDEGEEYIYALNMLFDVIIKDITILAIRILFHILWECVVFLISYRILWKYCGRFHFTTSFKYYFSSCVMCPIALICVKYIPFHMVLWSIPVLIMSTLLLIISPVSATNKPLDKKKTAFFGINARIAIICLFVFYTTLMVLSIMSFAKTIYANIIFLTSFAVVGKMQLNILQKVFNTQNGSNDNRSHFLLSFYMESHHIYLSI